MACGEGHSRPCEEVENPSTREASFLRVHPFDAIGVDPRGRSGRGRLGRAVVCGAGIIALCFVTLRLAGGGVASSPAGLSSRGYFYSERDRGGSGDQRGGGYERAMRDIQEGEGMAKQGRYMEAASLFLHAKHMWRQSGERGWEAAQSLADASVDK